MDGWKTRGAALVWRHLAPQRMRIGYLRFLFFFSFFYLIFPPRFVLSFPRCAVLNHFTAYNVCKITSEMMYRHGMVFTSDRSSGIGCNRPRRRVFVVHEISGTPLRVCVSSKSIFIVFLSLSLSLFLPGKFCRFYSIVTDIVDCAIRFSLFEAEYLDALPV